MKKTYSDLLRDPRWQKKRNGILERDNYTCQICHDTTTELNVHHKRYINGNAPWDYPDDDLITYCADCHGMITAFTKEGITSHINHGFHFIGECLPKEVKIRLYYLNNGEVMLSVFRPDHTIHYGLLISDKEQLALLQFLVKKEGLILIE